MKVLIVRVGAMGDVLHALPAVTALRRAQPDWTIDWVVDPRWAPLLVDAEGQGPVVGRVYLAETKLWSRSPVSIATLRSIGRLRKELRAAKYDVAVDMQGTLRSAVLGGFAKAARFVGYADPREALAARLYKTKVPRQGAHVVPQSAALLAEATGVALAPAFIEAAARGVGGKLGRGRGGDASDVRAGRRRRMGGQAVAGGTVRRAGEGVAGPGVRRGGECGAQG